MRRTSRVTLPQRAIGKILSGRAQVGLLLFTQPKRRTRMAGVRGRVPRVLTRMRKSSAALVEHNESGEPMHDVTGTSTASHTVARLRILLVEDHLILRQGLRALLETNSDIEIVGEAGTVADALALVEVARPAVVVTDLGLPDRSGIELVAELRARHPQMRVLVLTAYSTEEHIRA